MSVVVAVKKDGVVYLGADSQVTCCGCKKTVTPNNFKIWHVNDEESCLMGHVGVVRDANVIKTYHGFISELDILHNNINYDFIVNSLVVDIVNVLDKRNYIGKDSDGIPKMFSNYIFAYKDKLFLIGKDLAVIEIDNFAAVGSGELEAVGSLHTTEELDPEERIIRAIKASAANDICVGYPIVIMNTANSHVKVIGENLK